MATQGPWGSGGDNGKGGGNRPPQGGPQRPWGSQGDKDRQPPQGGRKGEQIPEIEDLVRKGQDRLRVLMGGRGGQGGGPRGPRGPQVPKFPINRGTIGFGALAAVAAWVVLSFYTVDQSARSVELFFGEPYAVGEPGLNFAPWPVVTREIVPVTGERVVEIGKGTAGPMDSGLMLTRDQNIVDVQYQIVWNVSNPEQFLFNLADPQDTIRAVGESAMRDIVARSEMAPILNRDREVIRAELEEAVQQTLDSYQAGINVVRVNLDRADPPREVIDSFREVQAAQQERDRLEKEADAYANRVLAGARGEAARLIEESEAYRAEAVNTAEGEAARFISVYAEYARAPDVTRKRMYLETMEKVLGDMNKVLLDGVSAEDGQGSGVVPYLPLDQLRGTGRPAQNQPAQNGGAN